MTAAIAGNQNSERLWKHKLGRVPLPAASQRLGGRLAAQGEQPRVDHPLHGPRPLSSSSFPPLVLLLVGHQQAPAAESLATGTVVAEPDKAVAEHLRALVTAARQRVRIEIGYAAASRSKAETRAIDPYGIVHHAGEWYLVGHCHKRGDTRTFRIDRIATVHVREESFAIPDDFDLETYRRQHLYVP